MRETEVVYVTGGRAEAQGAQPKRRAFLYQLGDPLPRIGESVIVDFEEGAPTRWIVQDVVHVVEEERHGIVIRLAAPYLP